MSSDTPQHDHLAALVDRLQLPPRVATLARSILQATTPHPPDPYTAACAVYIASSSTTQTHVPLSALLNTPGAQLRIPHFFDTAKGIAAETAARLPSHTNPSRIVHLSHRAFMVCADVWRKLRQLYDATLLHQSPDAIRLAWLFFLVCKAHLSSPTDSALPPISAYHLMLACLVESGLVLDDANPVQALCTPTEAVPAEISKFRSSLRAALPPALRETLPLYSADAQTSAICKTLTSEYEALLSTTHHRHATDERVFLESPHLLLSPPSDSEPSVQEPSTPLPSPSRKRPSDTDLLQTPQKRPNRFRDTMPVTPNRISRQSSFPRADDLDALAAVACSTPRSHIRPPRIPPVPPTPMTAGCAAVAWLHNLVDTRQETCELSNLDCPPHDLKPGKQLEAVVDNPSLWCQIVNDARNLSDKLCDEMPELRTPQRKREAMAVYFSALEGILGREASRLAKQRKRFNENLMRNIVFHKGVLTCSWEVTAAAYGRRDMTVFIAAMKAFQLSPFCVTKAVESFVLRQPDMPRALSKHLLTCEARIIESLAWSSNSELVSTLKQRSSPSAKHEETVSNTHETPDTPSERKEQVEPKPDSKDPTNSTSVADFSLELFYRKLLAIASDRVQELLIKLRMDAILESVWSCVKHSVWEKWHLMVDRHLDQIIMCCIYGVSKVRRYHLKFKDIITTYRKMSHTREPSFSHLVPGVFRDLPLGDGSNLSGDHSFITVSKGESTRGDIIKFYNLVFIHSMKTHLLKFQVKAPQAETKLLRNSGPNVATIAETDIQSSEFPPSLTSTPRTVTGESTHHQSYKDRLSNKVMSSPLRVLRPHASPKRIGRVTVSPMSPSGRLASLRQSPGRRSAILGAMTPGTRTLYAFGESPVRNLDRINRSLSGEKGRVRRPVPLNFEGRNVQMRSESIRRRYADVLGMPGISGIPGIRRSGTRLVTAGENRPSDSSESEGQVLSSSVNVLK